MIKIIGFERNTGNYKGFDYDNTIIYFVTDTNPNVNGFKGGSTGKIKTSVLAKMLGCEIQDIGIAINRKAEFHYDFSETPPVLAGITLFTDEHKK